MRKSNNFLHVDGDDPGMNRRRLISKRPMTALTSMSEVRARIRAKSEGTLIAELSLHERCAALQQMARQRTDTRLASFIADLTRFCDEETTT